MTADSQLSRSGWTARLAERLGISRALVYTVLARVWSVSAGAVSLLFISRNLTGTEQGFYYTFWSVLGLWVFFDVGLTFVISQFASHERARLQLIDGRMQGDLRARERLASLLRLSIRWYTAAGILMYAIVMLAGLLFFSRYRPAGADVAWVGPWLLVVATSVVNLAVSPFNAILEGSGLISDTALMRVLQAVVSNVLLWCALLAGAGLWSAVVLNGVGAVFAVSWLTARHRRFFKDLAGVDTHGQKIHWREEIWPFQWRFAISWMTAYLMFQLFNPVLFAAEGAEEAGRMGMSLMIATAIAMFAQSWINTRAVDYGSYVAARRYEKLDAVFRLSLVQSVCVMMLLSLAFLAAVLFLRNIGHPLAERLLPPRPLALLFAASVLNQIVAAEATFLRAFKREPFLGIYVAMAAATAAGSFLAVGRFGATGMMTALLLAVLLIGVGGGTIVFIRKRREWQSEAP